MSTAKTTKKPVLKKPAKKITKKPAAKPALKKSAIKKPAAKPALKKPAIKKPAAKSALKKPAPKPKIKKPALKKPAPKPETYRGPKGSVSIVEIEILRRDIDRAFGGKKIKRVEVLNPKSMETKIKPNNLSSILVETEVLSVSREGTALFIEFTKGYGSLAVVLGEGGQIVRHSAREAVNPATALILTFTQGGQLRINSHLGDTKIYYYKSENQGEGARDLRGTGIDLVEVPIPWSLFLRRLREQSQNFSIKELLLDPVFMVGLGDIYSDEILYKCGLKYSTPLKDIPDKKVILLLQAAVGTLHEAEKHRGTTLPGSYFCDLEGKPGNYQKYLNVYGREGEMTPFSMHEIIRKRFQNRWTYFCPKIQI